MASWFWGRDAPGGGKRRFVSSRTRCDRRVHRGVIIAFVALDGDRIFLAVLCVGQGSTSFPMLSLWSNTTVSRPLLARVHDIRELTASARRFSSTSAWTEPLAVSDELRQQKSTFQAYATRFRIQADGPSNTSSLMRNEVIPQLLAHIQETDARTRRASHAMYAWRMRPATPIRAGAGESARMIVFGSSNGGEAGAGERLERLLELGNCEDVVLIVFRWYGGVKLGSDRWRCISAVAKEALERGGFLAGSSGDDSRSKGSNDTRKRRK